MTQLIIRGEPVEVDEACVDLVTLFNNNNLDTRHSCEGHGVEDFEIIFEGSVDDNHISEFIKHYENKYGHSPFLGRFMKWTRLINQKVTSNWLYNVSSVRKANVDYRRMIDM